MRLIDADELILHLNDYALQEAPFRGESADTYNAIENCIKAVEEQPTAYDVDKVARQIRRNSGKWYRDVDGDYVPPMIETEHAIETAKKRIVSDDVCEWKEDAYGRWHTDCHYLADNEPLEYTYCPYCGKKIKVVDNDK